MLVFCFRLLRFSLHRFDAILLDSFRCCDLVSARIGVSLRFQLGHEFCELAHAAASATFPATLITVSFCDINSAPSMSITPTVTIAIFGSEADTPASGLNVLLRA